MVVVYPVFLTGVVGWVNIDALDPAFVRHAQIAKRVEVVAFDQQVLKRGNAYRHFFIQLQSNEIVV